MYTSKPSPGGGGFFILLRGLSHPFRKLSVEKINLTCSYLKYLFWSVDIKREEAAAHY
jgi:hypothetical protein